MKPSVACSLSLSLAAQLGCLERGEVLTPGTETVGAPSAVVSDVSTGQQHTLAVMAGRLYAWGENDSGKLGVGDTDWRYEPTPVTSSRRFRAVAAANEHSCAVDDLSDVYCFGEGARGQLGQGDRESSLVPLKVSLPAPAASISARFNHTCALLKDATLYCWGQNDEGQLGQSDPGVGADTTAADGLRPLPVGSAEWLDVGTGDGHTCAVRLDGALLCWGRNTNHELPDETRIQVRSPTEVDTARDWLRAMPGQQYTCAIKRDASVWCWGENVGSGGDEGFPLGLPADEVDRPTRVGNLEAADLSTEVFHTCSVSHDSELYCWGRGIEGQLGTGDIQFRSTPTLVATDIAKVSTSWFTTCVLTLAGRMGCAGMNEHGELGTGDTMRQNVFTEPSFSPAP